MTAALATTVFLDAVCLRHHFAPFFEFVSFPFGDLSYWSIDALFEHIHENSPVAVIQHRGLWHIAHVGELSTRFVFPFQREASFTPRAFPALELETAIPAFTRKLVSDSLGEWGRGGELVGVQFKGTSVEHVLSHLV